MCTNKETNILKSQRSSKKLHDNGMVCNVSDDDGKNSDVLQVDWEEYYSHYLVDLLGLDQVKKGNFWENENETKQCCQTKLRINAIDICQAQPKYLQICSETSILSTMQ